MKSECRKCEYRKMCNELPIDLSCDDVKHIANCGAKMDGKEKENGQID